MGSGKGGDGEIRISRYFMSMHMGICAAGEGLRLRQIFVGEKSVWSGNRSLAQPIDISRRDIFGGVEKEGGVSGIAYWLPGAANQVLPNALAKRFRRTAATSPGFRGVASMFFVGRRSVGTAPSTPGEWSPNGEGPAGFYWAANNPYLRPVWFKVSRPPLGLNPNIAMIPIGNEENPDGANPAHVIYECLHDRTWGGAIHLGASDRASFEAAAQVLYDEGFAISAQWTRQSTIEEFVNEILDHINATLYLHPRTGKLTLKLLRADYELADLRRITPDNAVIENLARRAWGETANEIVVTYTDPATEQPATVSAQDLAGIAAQGGPASASRDYHAVRSARLATTLAERELAASVHPMATCDLLLSREAWDLIPGEVVLLEGWDELGIGQMVMRVAKVAKDGTSSGTIRASVYEDIFGAHISNYVGVSGTEWENPASEPMPITDMIVSAPPAFLMAAKFGVDNPADLDPAESAVMLLPKRATSDDAYYTLLGPVTLPNGTVEMQSLGARDFAGTALLPADLPAEAVSVITSFDEVLGETPRNGQFVVIGPAGAGPDVAEIALVASVDENGWTLYRGVLDTVPSTWPAGTTIWCVPGAEAIPDDTVRAFGEFVTYKLLPTTSLGTLDEDDAPEVVAQASRRPHRVLRPANVKINGTGFGIVDASNVSSLTITWARRNRSYEATQALQWTDGDVAPEAGQETVIRVMDSSGVIILEIGAPGTSYTLNTSSFGGRTSGQIQVLSRRSGFDSMQAYTLHVANIGATANYLRLSGDTAGDPTDSLLLSGDAQSSGIDKLRIT